MLVAFPPAARVLALTVIPAFSIFSLPLLLSADASGQSQSDIVFKSSVRQVVVDVVVTGSDGKPVSGLKADDFTVAEDGKSQKILSFDNHNFDPVSEPVPARPNLPVNTFMNLPSAPERGPLYVLLLDLLNMEMENQGVARKQLLKFVLSKPLGTRFAVFVLSDGLYLAQGFTEDRNVLARALDPTETHAHLPRIFLNADNYRAYYSLPRVLINIAKFLSDLPGHKNVIWLSESFPSAILPTSEPGKDAVSFNDEVREATDALAREQVAVYPIDVRGAIVTSPSASASARGAPGSGNAAINASYMTEEEIASTTGGHAFFSTNDLASALAEATENGGRYYTLTYSPSNQDYNGRVRHIRVEVSKRGYSLAYRHAYFGSPNFVEPGSSDKKNASEEMAALERRVDSLNPHMKSGAPIVHQVLFRVHLRPVGRPGKATPAQMAKLEREQPSHADSKKNQVKVRRPIDIQTYQIDYTIAAREKTLEVAATAFDENGRSLNGVVQRVDQDDSASIKEDSHEGIYRIEQQIDVPTTANSIRVGVKDVKTNNVGAMEVSLPLAPEGPTADASIHHSSTARQAEDR